MVSSGTKSAATAAGNEPASSMLPILTPDQSSASRPSWAEGKTLILTSPLVFLLTSSANLSAPSAME